MLNKLKIAAKSMVALIGFVFTVIRQKLTGRSYGVHFLHRTFFVFGGLPSSLASKFLGSKKIYISLNDINGLESGTTFKQVNDALNTKGFFVEKKFIENEKADDVVRFAQSTMGRYRLTDQGLGGNEHILFERDKPLAVRYDYNPSTVLKCQVVQEVLSDPRVLSIAQNYLGRQPILDFVAMWWHAKSATPDKNAAQYFHFDMDRLRWVKFFFYVTNVTSANGPHVFVPSSQRDYGVPFVLRKKGYARLTDDEVEKCFPKESWETFTGSAGTMIVEDTRGLHKGAHVQQGDRLLFQFQFTTSLYGNAEEPDDMTVSKNDLGGSLERAMNQYPFVYQKIKVCN